jgi:hypothetical protein
MEASHFALFRFTGRPVIGVLRTLFTGNEGQLVPGNFGPVAEPAVAAGLFRGGAADADLVVATPREPLTSNPITPRLTASRGTLPLRKRLESISLLLVVGLSASSQWYRWIHPGIRVVGGKISLTTPRGGAVW